MKYVCQVCGYVYDEAKEGVPFADLPDTWACPWCKAPKSAFQAEKEEKTEAAEFHFADDQDVTKLSAGQMAALCSNLARGLEKQYNSKAAAMFAELADYFSAVTPAVPDASVFKLGEMLQADIENYAGARRIADENGDRGAARALVWGEKVTRMLSSLVEQYMKDGDKMLDGTEIWVCTACGFVYVGDAAPEKCPVCRVPDYKFEKIERREQA